jgi:hypothetical protein
VGSIASRPLHVNKAIAPKAPRTNASELANCAAPALGALVGAVTAAVPEPLAVREAARVLTLVEPRVCELNVELRDTGTPVLIEAPVAMEVIDEFMVVVDSVEAPE